KKRKGAKGQDVAVEATPSEAGNISGLLSPRDAEFSPSQLEEAQKTLSQLRTDLDAKVAVIERLEGELAEKETSMESIRKKLKDQDDLKEEIESLRDDLINIGQEHVTAKDKIR